MPRSTLRAVRWLLPLGIAGVIIGPMGVPRAARAGGTTPTTCANLCTGTPDPCVVSSTVNVVPGSTIDCGTRAVQVSGGDLLVHDGQFALIAGSLTVSSAHKISADCPLGTTAPGFFLRVGGDVSVPTSSGSSLKAICDAGGGVVSIDARGDVSIAGTGIDVNASAGNAPGGTISITAGGSVTTSAILTATSPSGGGVSPGGHITITGTAITIGDDLIASGAGTSSSKETGGTISVQSSGDVTITSTDVLSLDAGTSYGNGGSISIEAGGTIQCSRPLRARGTGPAGIGGSIRLEAERVVVNNDVITSAGLNGGKITLESRGGTIEVATGSSGAVDLDVGGDNGGSGGEITLSSGGGDITVAANGTLTAGNGGGGGDGGRITIDGVSVTLSSGSHVVADGGAGSVMIQSRDATTLSGTVHATGTGGEVDIVYRSGTPTIGSGVSSGYDLSQDASLPAPCGDDILRSGVEDCDGSDLGGQTCNGTLACTSSCTLDTSGCH